ncbi:unnamed protein product, partial [Didymodactylos carnosus]
MFLFNALNQPNPLDPRQYR